jgi:hypothetical protein
VQLRMGLGLRPIVNSRRVGDVQLLTEESVGCTTEGRPLTPALSPSDGAREHGGPPRAVGQPDDRVV